MKYVIIEKMGMEIPIIFPEFVKHSFFADIKPISAGKCDVALGIRDHEGFVYQAYGESISLKLKSRPEDAKIIEHAFEFLE